MQGLLFENNLWSFIILTCVVGGAMAFSAGGAVANGWKTYRHMLFYTFLLVLADRFLQFSLFKGSLLSMHFFLVDFMILLAAAWLGYLFTRSAQMRRQYGFRSRSEA